MQPTANRSWLAPLVIVLAVAASYGNTLGLGFAWDDHSLILENPRIADPDYPRDLFLTTSPWRPLKRLTLAIDYRLWGPDRPWGFHLTNTLFHAAASLLLWRVARRLGLGEAGAAVAAVGFALHPAHVEAVASITNRKESMALAFSLLGLLACVALRSAGARSRPARAGLGFAAVVAYGLGLLSKEVGAVMLPAACLTWEVLFATRSPNRGRWRLFAGGAVIAAVLAAILSSFVNSVSARFGPEDVLWVTLGATDNYWLLLLTALKAVAFYVALLVLPWPLYADRGLAIATGPFDGGVVVGALVVVALIAAAVVAARRLPIASFGIAWFLLNLLPVLNLVPLTYWLVAERFVYGPSAGAALLLGAVYELVHRRLATRSNGAALPAAVVGLFVIYALLSARQNRVFASDGTLWTQTVKHRPESYLGWAGVAESRAELGDPAGAEAAYRRAIALRPDYADPHHGLARILYADGRHAEALTEARIYARARPYDPGNLVLLGTLALEASDLREAIHCYGLARAYGDRLPETHFNLANALFQAGRHQQALAALDRAPAESYAEAPANFLRGRTLQALGQADAALTSYQRAAELSPGNPRPHTAAALILMRLGRRQEAAATFAKSLAILPNQPEVQRVLEALRAEQATIAP